jgi:cytoskeletal protein RodZ
MLGEKLKKRREALGGSVEELSREIPIAPHYLKALEENDYDVFPAKVFALGFLRKVLMALAFENSEKFVKEFSDEWEVKYSYSPKELKPVPQNRGPELYFKPQNISIGISLLFFILFAGYLSFRTINFVKLPSLSIDEPADKISVTSPVIRIKGHVEKESQLTVNGRALNVDADGNFKDEFELAAGVNTLKFLVKDKFGRENSAIRHVLVK